MNGTKLLTPQKKEQILENEPASKRLEIRQMHLLGDHLMEINRKVYRINNRFLQNVLKHMKLSPLLQLTGQYSPDEITAMINKGIVNYFKRKSSLGGYLIGTKQEKTLFRFTQNHILPYSVLLEIVDHVEKMFDEAEVSIHKPGGIKFIFNDSKINRIPEVKGEEFSNSMGIVYDYGKYFNVKQFSKRIACSNQLPLYHEDMEINKKQKISAIVGKLMDIKRKKDNWEKYVRKVQVIHKHPASLKEYETITKLLRKHKINKNKRLFLNLTKKLEVEDFLNNGQRDAKEKNKVFVPVTYWELINAVTNVATHNEVPLTLEAREDLFRKANEFFKRIPDFQKALLN